MGVLSAVAAAAEPAHAQGPPPINWIGGGTVGVRGVAVSPDGQTRWYDSDGGGPKFRVARSGCFRSAVALPPGEAGRLVALRLHAHTRLPQEGEPPLPPGTGRARLTRINKLFLLGEDDEPAENLFGWAGEAALVAEGPPLELALAGRPR